MYATNFEEFKYYSDNEIGAYCYTLDNPDNEENLEIYFGQ